MSKNDHKPQQHNTTGQSQHDHSNKDVLSNGAKVNPAAKLVFQLRLSRL